jgi:hypothetical protein
VQGLAPFFHRNSQLSGDFALNVTGTLTDLRLYMHGPGAGTNFYADTSSLPQDVLSAPDVTTLAATGLSAVGTGTKLCGVICEPGKALFGSISLGITFGGICLTVALILLLLMLALTLLCWTI